MQRVVLLERFSHTIFETPTSLTFRGNIGVLKVLQRNLHVAQTFYGSPSVLTIRGNGLVTYSEAKPYSTKSIADSNEVDKKKRLVVLGTGWGGINFLKDLKNTSLEVQIISTQNYFGLNSLLPCVATGTLQARSLAEPVRNVIRKKNVDMHFSEAECAKIDAENRKVHCRSTLDLNGNEEFVVDYDYLVIAVGARSNTFNIPGVSENCLFLKNVEDAENIRRTIIDCFERASLPNLSEEERKRILHFVVVGGGPTGVELAGQLHDYVNKDLARLYPEVKDLPKITLLEASDILNMFHKKVKTAAEKKFQRDGIDLKKGARVVKVSEKEIFIEESKSGNATSLPYGMAVWSTGIGARPVIKDFVKQIGQGDKNAVVVDEWMRVEGCESVYAFGDCAVVNQRKVLDDIPAIFQTADKDNSGTLTDKEFQEIFSDLCKRYPQVEHYFKSKKIRNLADLLKVSKGGAVKNNIELDIEEFKAALSEVDSHIKKLPATGQVASQQGIYLADCFNRMEECEKKPEGPIRFGEGGRYPFQPFRYDHLGLLVSLGGEKAGMQLPTGQELVGRLSQSVWYLTYITKLVSWRTRVHVISDWTRRFMFGRDPNCV